MDTKNVKYFLAVAKYRNFTKAASELGVTQSAVSHSIAELESELNTKLFTRTTRSVTLTLSGEVFLKAANELMSLFNRLQTDIVRADSKVSGGLRIGHIVPPYKNFLPKVMNYFQEKYPDIGVEFYRENMGALFEAFYRGDTDIHFTYSFDVEGVDGVDYKYLLPETISLVVHPSHPLAEAEHIDYALLSGEPFVQFGKEESPKWYDLVMKLCVKRGFVPNIVYTPNTIDAVLMDVKVGQGVSILPSSIGTYINHGLKFIEIEGEDTRISKVVAWKKDNKNAAVPHFLSALDSYCAI